jgi:hypothetical protein
VSARCSRRARSRLPQGVRLRSDRRNQAAVTVAAGFDGRRSPGEGADQRCATCRHVAVRRFAPLAALCSAYPPPDGPRGRQALRNRLTRQCWD